MSEQDLKPCPFCGCSEVAVDERYHVWVVCENPSCMAEGPMRLDKAEAIRLWNTRAKQEKEG